MKPSIRSWIGGVTAGITAAVDQLGSAKGTVRAGGAAALGPLPDDVTTTIAELRKPRHAARTPAEEPLDLRGIRAPRSDWHRAFLRGADLTGADLTGTTGHTAPI